MTAPPSTLSLVPRTRSGGERGYWAQNEREASDFVVDGQSLHDRMGLGDVAGVLWGLPYDRVAARQLLLRDPSELPTGRVPLYVCAECGGVDCGVVAARVEETDAAYVWSDFTNEVTYYYDSSDERVQFRYEGVGPFAFDKAAYRDVIGAPLASLPESPRAVDVEPDPDAWTLLATFASGERRLFRVGAALDQPALSPPPRARRLRRGARGRAGRGGVALRRPALARRAVPERRARPLAAPPMGMDLFISEHRDPDKEPVEMARSLFRALDDVDGYLGSRLPRDLVRRLEPEPSENQDRLTPRDAAAMKGDLGVVRSLVEDRNDEFPILYRFSQPDASGKTGSGVVVPFRTVDFTDPAERRARLVSDHGDPGRRGQIRVIYLRPHPDAVRWARRHRDRSWLERKRDDIRSTWLFYRGPIPNTMGGGTPTPPRPHFAEEDSEWMQAEPTIEVLGERVEVEWDDAVAQCVPSLDRAIALCERAERAGRPVFWTFS